MNNGHWLFPEQMRPSERAGFVYIVYDIVMKRGYIGKKSYTSIKRGREVESEWQYYKTSSPILAEMFHVRPLSDFWFVCLEEYKTKGTLSYAETWTLCLLETPTTDAYYNKRIEAVSWVVKEPISQRHKNRLRIVTDQIG